MPSRRTLLASAGAALAAGTSGCATPFTGASDADRVDSEPTTGGARAVQYDPGHRGWAAASPPTESPRVAWRLIVAPWKTVPVGTEEAVYVVDGTDHLLKIDPTAGGIDWTTELARTGGETPAVGEEILYVPARERGQQPDVCLGIDPEDGSERWRVDHGGHVTPVDGGAAVGGEGTEALSLVEPDGTVRWTADLGAFGSPPAFADGAITVGTEGGTVSSFALDGTERWTTSVAGDAVDAPTAAPDGTVFVVTQAGAVVALRPDGTERWTVALDVNGVESPTLADGVLYVPTGDTTVALDTADGTELWRSDRATGTAQIVAADTLYGTRDDLIVALDRETGDQRWSVPVYPRRYADSMIGEVRTTPVAIGDQLLVAAASGELFSLR